MPRRKTVTEVVEDAADDKPIEIVDESEIEETEQEDALDGLLSEFMGADNIVVNVYRQGEGKNLNFLFKTHPQEMTGGDIMETCRDKYGTGDYRVHIREGRRIISNRPFSVEAPKVAEVEAPKTESFGMSELMALMSKQNEQMQTLMLGTMTALANAFSNQGAPAQAPVDLNGLVQSVAALKAMSDDKRTEPGAVEMLIKGLELAKDMAPKTGETNVADLGLKFMEALPMLQAAGNKQAPQPRPAPPALKAPDPGGEKHPMMPGPQTATVKPGPIQATKPEPQNEPDPNEQFWIQAKQNLQWLCRQASRNGNPELYAEVVLDQFGEEKTLEFVGKPDALNTLAQIEPAVGLYPGWFNALRDAILNMTGEQTDEPSEPVPNDSQVDDGLPTQDPGVVVARIDASGLRTQGREGATVTIPGVTDAEDNSQADDAPDAGGERHDGDPSSDT